MKLNKWQLDCLATLAGFLSGLSLILAANGILPLKIALVISGIGLLLLGQISQKPADLPPTTKELEDRQNDRNY